MCFFLTDFDVEIDRFMLDWASCKKMKSYEQDLKLYSNWMFDGFEIVSPINEKLYAKFI